MFDDDEKPTNDKLIPEASPTNTLDKSQKEQFVGQCIAEGYSHSGIITKLLDKGYATDNEEALKIVRGVYNEWQRIEQALDLQEHDPLNYHIYMRHKLLLLTMGESGTARTALAVLDSLATLQGVERKPPEERLQAIVIELVPKRTDEHAEETQHGDQDQKEIEGEQAVKTT